VLEKNEIKLSAEDQFKITTLVEMVMGKLAKRSIRIFLMYNMVLTV